MYGVQVMKYEAFPLTRLYIYYLSVIFYGRCVKFVRSTSIFYDEKCVKLVIYEQAMNIGG